jgi:hypothetical protein
MPPCQSPLSHLFSSDNASLGAPHPSFSFPCHHCLPACFAADEIMIMAGPVPGPGHGHPPHAPCLHAPCPLPGTHMFEASRFSPNAPVNLPHLPAPRFGPVESIPPGAGLPFGPLESATAPSPRTPCSMPPSPSIHVHPYPRRACSSTQPCTYKSRGLARLRLFFPSLPLLSFLFILSIKLLPFLSTCPFFSCSFNAGCVSFFLSHSFLHLDSCLSIPPKLSVTVPYAKAFNSTSTGLEPFNELSTI